MPDADAKVAQLQDQYPALAGLAVLMEEVIAGADRVKVPPEKFVAWLHAIARHVQHVGLQRGSLRVQAGRRGNP